MDRITYPGTPTRSPVKLRGFTLIELLVVISIIALLVGILLPALGAARRTAQNSQCLSNIKQMGTAATAFAADHKFHVQISSTDTVWGTSIPRELRGKVAQFVGGSSSRVKDWASAIVPYMSGTAEDDFENANTRVTPAFTCPSDANQDVTPSGYQIYNNISGGIGKENKPISYGVNADATTYNNNGPVAGAVWAGGFTIIPYKGDATNGSLDEVRTTSKTMLFADCGTKKAVGTNLLGAGDQLFYSATTNLLSSGLADQIRDIGTLSAIEQNTQARQRIPLASNDAPSTGSNPGGPGDRHSDKVNVAFVDGHAGGSGIDSFSDVYLSPHK
jgi:prepilin-type N-terminal cleavage/methylation domain-containing protein/prepilin-type processing-associated H-X9-DG protein